MTNSVRARSGQSGASRENTSAHTLVVLVRDQQGAVDRVVNQLRRRRANTSTLVIGRCEQPGLVRVTAQINDAEVEVTQLVEQLGKIVNVAAIVNMSTVQSVCRELALLKVEASPTRMPELIEIAQAFGAHVVDMSTETLTFEVTASSSRIQELLDQVQRFGIREIVRTGAVSMTRGNNHTFSIDSIK